jgi:E3 ubiquitin-protein ligase mind-bomb
MPSKKQLTTALHVAVIKNSADCLRVLLASNADVNAQDCFGDSPLHDAIGRGYNELFGLLLDTPGLNLQLRNKRGFNVLQHAALKGNELLVHQFYKSFSFLFYYFFLSLPNYESKCF